MGYLLPEGATAATGTQRSASPGRLTATRLMEDRSGGRLPEVPVWKNLVRAPEFQ